VLLLLPFVAFGCHRDADEDLGLALKEAPVLRLDALTEPKALVDALQQPVAPVDRKLGARGVQLVRTTELKAGSRSDVTVSTFRFDTDGKGGFHLSHELDHPEVLAPAARDDDKTKPVEKVDPLAQGMEAIWLPDHLYVRPRYGRFIDRHAEPGELDRLRALVERVLGDDIELLAPFLALEKRGANVVALSLKPNAHGEKIDDPARAWRAAMTVSELAGQITLDAQTGVPTLAQLSTRYRIERDGEAVDVHLTLEQTARAPTPVTAPEAVPAPRRAHPIVERNQLLDGLAPPAGTQAARAP
jgi:hypothetical protein